LTIEYTFNGYVAIVARETGKPNKPDLNRTDGTVRKAITDNGYNDTSVQSQHPLTGESGNEGGSERTSEG